MKKNRMIIIGVTLLAVCLCANLQASDSSITPPPENPVRKVVIDALRQEMKRINGLDMVFVVRHLKVKNGWAWVHTLPQSPDGSNRYEDVSALLQLHEGVWRVIEIPCSEDENPDCPHGPEYFSRLQQKFPSVPAEIFTVDPAGL